MGETIRGERARVAESSGEDPPDTPAPVGATDCHVHIFDPRFPRAPGRTGPWATVDDLLALRRRLGLSRTVVVYPQSYGPDNGALLDALARLGDSARGIVRLPPDASERDLDDLHARGVRGIRLYLAGDPPPTAGTIRTLAARLAPRGWHIQFVVRDRELVAAESLLVSLPCRIVLDHFAYLKQPAGLRQPAGDALRRLLEQGNTYVKLSGVYLVSEDRHGSPGLTETARQLVELAPGRALWGSDWPHTLSKGPTKPDGAALFDLLTAWVPDQSTRHRVLVGNPQALYWHA